MKYLPATVIALGTSVVVGLGLYVTNNPNCLWGLILGFFFAYHAIPFTKDER